MHASCPHGTAATSELLAKLAELTHFAPKCSCTCCPVETWADLSQGQTPPLFPGQAPLDAIGLSKATNRPCLLTWLITPHGIAFSLFFFPVETVKKPDVHLGSAWLKAKSLACYEAPDKSRVF